MNPRDKYHNVDKQHIMNIHYSWHSQQHRTQSYNENIADLNISIFHHFNVRSPRSDPWPYQLLTYLLSDRRSDAIIIVYEDDILSSVRDSVK